MIFVVRQLVEKSWEHQAKMFFIFIDLRKEYDSVPRAALWQTLGKLGVLDSTVDLIKSFHQETRLNYDSMEPSWTKSTSRMDSGCLAPMHACLRSGGHQGLMVVECN